MTVLVTGKITDATGREDSRRWRAYSPVYREGSNGEVVNIRPQSVRVVAGHFTAELEPGIVVIENPEGTRYTVTVPNENANLWDIIEQSVAFPPDTAADALAAAVSGYMEDNPVVTMLVEGLTDAGTPGKNALLAETQADARAAIGAGTSNLAIGTTGSTAKAGNWVPAADDISDASDSGKTVVTGTPAEALTALGAAVDTRATAVLFGTSQEARAGVGVDNIVNSAATWDVTTRGWWNWFTSYAGHCLNLVHNAGVNGNTSTQMLARIDADVLAYNPGWVFIGGPANDAPTGITAAQTIANYTAIYEALRGRSRIVQLTMPPRTENDTTDEKTAYATVNAWLCDAPTTYPHVETVDIAGLVVDPSTGGPLTDTLFDTVHYTEATANKIGWRVAQAVKPRLPARPRHRVTIGHPANVLSDPGIQSTAFTAPDVSTSTFTYVNDDETMGRRARLVITGNTGGTQEHYVRCLEPSSAGRWAVGSKVRAQVRIKFTDLQPVDLTTARRFHPILRIWTRHVDNTTFVTTDQALGLSSGEANKQIRGLPVSGEITLRTPWRVIPANIDRLYFDAGWLGAVSGTIEMWEPVLEKEV